MLQLIESETLKNPIPLLDDEGFLIDADQWTAAFSELRAAEINVELDHRHWALIKIIRDKYLRLGALPLMRNVCKAAGFEKSELKHQFGSCLTLCKIAGLPYPGEEAKTYMN